MLDTLQCIAYSMNRKDFMSKMGRPKVEVRMKTYGFRLPQSTYDVLLAGYLKDIKANGILDSRGRRKTISSYLRNVIMGVSK